MDNISAMAYADDIVLVSTTKEGLQKAINATYNYCKKWKLEVNSKKTKCVTFTKGTQKENHIFRIGEQSLENTREMKYLGISMNKQNASFTPAVEALKTKATRALYGLRSKIDFRQLPVSLSLKLFDCLIRPILLYASEVWVPFMNHDSSKWDYNVIERVHMQFIKRILGVNRSTTNILVRGEVNRHSLLDEATRRNIRYAGYIHKKDPDTLVKQAYEYQLSRPLNSITFMNIINEHSGSISSMHKEFLSCSNPYENIYAIEEKKMNKYIYLIFHKEWRDNLDKSKKGECYKSFKEKMKFEPYLNNLKRPQRVVLTKLRTSDHKLLIEEGRRMKPQIPREERICKFCNNGIESEEHFLVECPLYGRRQIFFNKVSESVPQFMQLNPHQKFIFLMTQEDDGITKMLVKEIQE